MIYVREVTQLLAALTNDNRYAEAVISAKEEGREIKTMCKVLDEIEERGIRKGIERGLEQGLERGIEQGMERGLEQGLERGIAQEMEHIVTVLLNKGKKASEINELCDIPIEIIRKIEAKVPLNA